MSYHLHYLKSFIIGGLTFAVISYIANNINASLAGFLVGIPVGILLMYFIIEENKIISYTITHTISIIVLFVVSLLLYLPLLSGVYVFILYG